MSIAGVTLERMTAWLFTIVWTVERHLKLAGGNRHDERNNIEDNMTGDQALLAVELAVLRVRDSHKATVPHNVAVIEVLDQLAKEIAKIASDTPCPGARR